jgi:hypothetical protein
MNYSSFVCVDRVDSVKIAKSESKMLQEESAFILLFSMSLGYEARVFALDWHYCQDMPMKLAD